MRCATFTQLYSHISDGRSLHSRKQSQKTRNKIKWVKGVCNIANKRKQPENEIGGSASLLKRAHKMNCNTAKTNGNFTFQVYTFFVHCLSPSHSFSLHMCECHCLPVVCVCDTLARFGWNSPTRFSLSPYNFIHTMPFPSNVFLAFSAIFFRWSHVMNFKY